jgi:signal transduction histidine kinase
MFGIIITGAGAIIWIRRGITMFYRKRIKERNINELEQKLLEKDEEIQRLTEIIEVSQVANHKFVKRLSAFENGLSDLIASIQSGKYSIEASEEFALKLDDIMRLKQNYDSDISQIKMEKPLPSTNINGIDDMFSYFSKKYSRSNIDFNLKIDGSIAYLIEYIIGQSDLETMIGDLLENALIAVNASDKTFRSILAIIGLSGDFYELTVFDSGIPFQTDTLKRLGKERVTTHADTGGSGIGFMTIFETMNKYGASLIINEKAPSESDYTKSITVRFDGKNRYIVDSYQFSEILRHEEQYTAM